MRLSVQLEPVEDPSRDIWITLEKIQHTLGWSESDLLARLEITEKQFKKLRAKGESPSLHAVSELALGLDLSLEAVTLRQIDYGALKAHYSGNKIYIPERFTVGAFSRKRTSINILQYLEKRLGWSQKKQILDHFQMTEAMFSHPDEFINLRFPTELFQFLKNSGYDSSIFYEMGAYSLVTNQGTPLSKIMKSLGAPAELHETIFSGVANSFYDRNCRYKILKLTRDYCLIGATTSEELRDAFGTFLPGSAHTCAARGGTFASLPGYVNLPFSAVTEETCVHRGDSQCTYRITYAHANALYLNRLDGSKETSH